MMGMMMGRGGMMPGRMGFASEAGMDNGCPCPMYGGPHGHGIKRRFLSKKERKEMLKEYLEELNAETEAVKELMEEEK